MSIELEDLLNRCEAFDAELGEFLAGLQLVDVPKTLLTISMCDLVLEHGQSLRILVRHGHLASAIALLRVQLDAVIRVVWVHFAADDQWVQEAMTFQPQGPFKDPTHNLTMTDLLDGIERDAPAELHRQLAEFKNAAWPALNSYVHSGIWPVAQRLAGDEIRGAIQTLRNSCGLTGMAAMIVATYTGTSVQTVSMKLLQLRHKDCLPPLKEP